MSVSAASGYHASDGAAYEVFLGRWTARLAPLFVDFADLPPDGAVLDVGCGTGSLAGEIAGRSPRRTVIGTDVAEPYLAFARERYGDENATFQQGDAGALPFADGSFAGALAQLVLTFVADARAVAREMVRVARPGGTVGAAVWDFCGGLVYQRMFWDTAAGIDPGAGRARDRLFSHPLSDPEALHALWRETGLADIRTGSLTIRMEYASFDDYWLPLLGGQGPVGMYVQSVDQDMRARLRSAVRGAYLSGRPDGPRSLTATAWAVRGARALG